MDLQSNEGLNILQQLITSGIINEDSVLDIVMQKRKEEIQKMHPYAITPPKEAGGRWQTSYRDKDGKRKNIKARTEEEILEKLISVYFSQTHLEKLTFHELYEEWLQYKATVTNSPNTIKRHKQHYNKYFESSILHEMKIKRNDEILLEQECNRIVKEFNLPRKEWYKALRALQMEEYMEVDAKLYFMDRIERKKAEKEVKRKIARNPVYKLACFCRLV